MFFMKDAAQQALDINIGRVLEMLRSGVLSRDAARDGLLRFFEGAIRHDAGDLNAYLTRILERVDTGSLDVKDARTKLVKAALASEKNDLRCTDILHRMVEEV
ncbi:hypothetical protein AEAC466_02240 [Asticcacaulis sp. AC466]|uniref:hypothetical protein n=1 Tax=Asticcacaulis sp. AC466 TaxID=1282362 RepID=UPI0003C40E8A|nr:hypothetical protein [Asticcacaulis sp. AC466]ESQ86027.1 hypothetical protein AEAC466_02240 [Asticcacaulis sp. AC466]